MKKSLFVACLAALLCAAPCMAGEKSVSELRQIAQAGGVSKRECYRRFRALLGQTPLEFLIRHRLTVAFYQLSTTSRPASRVGEACGFPSASYFTKQFKKLFGVSPGQVSRRNADHRCGIPYDPWYFTQVHASSGAERRADDGARNG